MSTADANPAALADRREQILQLALRAAGQRRRRRAVATGVRGMAVLAVAGLAWWLMSGHTDHAVTPSVARSPSTIELPPPPALPAPPAPSAPPVPMHQPGPGYAFVQLIEPRPEGYAHLLVHPPRHSLVQVLDDDALLGELAALHRPAAIIIIDGRSRVLLATGG